MKVAQWVWHLPQPASNQICLILWFKKMETRALARGEEEL